MFEPSIQEIQGNIDYACIKATDWIKNLLSHHQRHIVKVAGIAGVSTSTIANIRDNRGIIDDPRMAIRILKQKEKIVRENLLVSVTPGFLTKKELEERGEIEVKRNWKAGRGLPPPKNDPYVIQEPQQHRVT
jgi:hypothetical protein